MGDPQKDEIKKAIQLIEQNVPQPGKGLGEELFHAVSRWTPMVNVDLLIRDDEGRTLLTWRSDRFYGPGWHFPGGVLRFKESYEQRIAEVARIELGATVDHEEHPFLVRSAMNTTRDTRGHFVSLLFNCQLTSTLDEARKAISPEPENGQWAWHATKPDNLLAVQNQQFGQVFD